MVSAVVTVEKERCTQSQQSLDAQIAPMVGRKLKSAAEEEAAAMVNRAGTLVGWLDGRKNQPQIGQPINGRRSDQKVLK